MREIHLVDGEVWIVDDELPRDHPKPNLTLIQGGMA